MIKKIYIVTISLIILNSSCRKSENVLENCIVNTESSIAFLYNNYNTNIKHKIGNCTCCKLLKLSMDSLDYYYNLGNHFLNIIDDKIKCKYLNDQQGFMLVDMIVDRTIIALDTSLGICKECIPNYKKEIEKIKGEIVYYKEKGIRDYIYMSKWLIFKHKTNANDKIFSSIGIEDFTHDPIQFIVIKENDKINNGDQFRAKIYPCVCGDSSYFIQCKKYQKPYKICRNHIETNVIVKGEIGKYEIKDSLGLMNPVTGEEFYHYFKINYFITQ
ncbi:MAG: hypothetical protein CVU05_10635 [Bacteroidetes bacterium HGW-Bacteroidetes-21]|nr:MAG: hypothetical protein CVU05_10635 [Bacteroidetes bacterium HGW-Bacteroidetes-21]